LKKTVFIVCTGFRTQFSPGRNEMKAGVSGVIALLVLVVASCDNNPSTPTGTLQVVSNLHINEGASAGQTVVLEWDELGSVDGYYIFFTENITGSWPQIGTSVSNSFSHTSAPYSGYYTVLAFEGSNTSSDFSNHTASGPIVIDSVFTIWDQNAVGEPTGFIFGDSYGSTGDASSESFKQDVYAFDGSWSQSPVGLFAGSAGYYPGGVYCPVVRGIDTGHAPPSGYVDSLWVQTGNFIYSYLSDNHYVKIFVDSVIPHPTIPDCHGIRFHYHYQPIASLRLFAR